METIRNTQTAFRFREDLLQKAKLKARLEHKSLNNYVEELIERDLNKDIDQHQSLLEELRALPKGRLPLDSGILSIVGFAKDISYGQDELDNDPKLAYLVEKYHLEMR